MKKLMLSIQEAVEETGLSYYFLRKLCLADEIFNVRSGTKYLINRNSLFRYLGEDVENKLEYQEANNGA